MTEELIFHTHINTLEELKERLKVERHVTYIKIPNIDKNGSFH